MENIDIKKVAQLSRLEIDEDKMSKFQKDFVAILEYFNKLKEVDVSDVAPMLSVIDENKNVYREDREDKRGRQEKEISRKEFLERAPEKKDNYLKVKAVLK